MPVDNRIALEIPQEVIDEVKICITTVQTKLHPYLVSLSPDERKIIPKMSDKTKPFVEKSLEYAGLSPEFIPSYLSIEDLKIDMGAVNLLTELYRPIEQLATHLDDSIMLSGSEAYIAALAYYTSVKMAAKMDILNAKSIYDDLKERFPGRPKESVSEPVSE